MGTKAFGAYDSFWGVTTSLLLFALGVWLIYQFIVHEPIKQSSLAEYTTVLSAETEKVRSGRSSSRVEIHCTGLPHPVVVLGVHLPALNFRSMGTETHIGDTVVIGMLKSAFDRRFIEAPYALTLRRGERTYMALDEVNFNERKDALFGMLWGPPLVLWVIYYWTRKRALDQVPTRIAVPIGVILIILLLAYQKLYTYSSN